MKDRARELRKNMTDAEKQLWFRLRNREFSGYKFRRQVVMGAYIVDFVCFDKNIIIEVDGGQHMEQADYDNRRTTDLEKLGYKVLRFWNNEVLGDLNGVLEKIRLEIF